MLLQTYHKQSGEGDLHGRLLRGHHPLPMALASFTESARRSAFTALERRSASRRVRSASTTSRKLIRPFSNRLDERVNVSFAATVASFYACRRLTMTAEA